MFGLDEDESYYGTLVRTLASRRPDVIRTDQPGLVVIQLDGLSHDVLSHSLRAGRVPELSRWIRTGTHKLGHWDALLPSTTPASQAGILHGNNDGIPNFRWLEKETGQILVANHPEDATVIESRISNGEGLLSMGGASISNIFTGDGDRAFLVMSTIKVKERGLGDSDAFAWFFVSPYNYINMMVRYVAEIIKENIQSRRQARAGIEPRMHRGFPYPAVRAATNVALRSLGTSLVIQEMLRGTPVIYMDYTDYDEIAHHSGPERPESLDALDGVDRELQDAAQGVGRRPAPVPLRRPGRPWPEPRRDLPAALRRDPSGRRALADGRPGVGRGGHRADRGLGPAEHVPGRGLRRRRASRVRSRGPSRATSARTGTSRWDRRRRSTRRPEHQQPARATRAPRLRPQGPQRRTARRLRPPTSWSSPAATSRSSTSTPARSG